MFACFSFPGQNKQVSFCNKHVYLFQALKQDTLDPFATCMRWSLKSASKSHQTMRRIHPHSYTSYTRILKTRWGMLGDQLFLNVSVVCSIQYTVHHTSVSVSFTFLIKTFCTPPGGNSVPKTLPHQLESWWIFSRYVSPKLRLWSQTFDGVVPKPVGFCVGNFLVKGNNSLFMFFLSQIEKMPPPPPQTSVGLMYDIMAIGAIWSFRE